MTNAAPGAAASAQALNAVGSLVNNEVSTGGFIGWAEFGTGVITTDELENLPAATYPSVRFYIKAGFTSSNPNAYRTVLLRIYMDDGDVYTRLLCPYLSTAWTLLEFDMSLFTPQLVPPNPNPAHIFGTEAGNIIGWSVFVSSWELGAATLLDTFDISVDDLEFLTGPIAPTPLKGPEWVDDLEDGNLINMHCNFWNRYPGPGLSTINPLAIIADGANATTTSLEASGNLNNAGALASSGVSATLQGLSAAIYKNLDFYIKATFPPPTIPPYSDISITINMLDGDIFTISYLTQCFAGGINGSTWTQVTIDLTDTATLDPLGALCIVLTTDMGFGHSNFGLETSDISFVSMGPWIWDGSGAWTLRLDEITFF